MKITPPNYRISDVRLFFIPVTTRVPLKFGNEVLTSVTCARACVRITDASGRSALGWGETPLSVQWVWPSSESYELRHKSLMEFCRMLAEEWLKCDHPGDALWVGYRFLEQNLRSALEKQNTSISEAFHIPWLAALVCNAPFDQALHDAYGKLMERPIFETYSREFMTHDLSAFLTPATPDISFKGFYPVDYFRPALSPLIPVWHLVGGLDPLTDHDLNGNEPNDAYPNTLEQWIRRDGLKCLKVKLKGSDARWDYERLRGVGEIGRVGGVEQLSADFNCTVRNPDYVCEILDRLKREDFATWEMLLYVEQPFPYELEPARIKVSAVSARKPLFLDESAHDWRMIRVGRELGWTGVALKTCKTQTGAILSACWARAHGMSLMVQDLTNPMLAQIPHVLLASKVGTICGVESNSMQFYPEASNAEGEVHPGIYRRKNGMLDISSIGGPGFGYRVEEITRKLPDPAFP